MSAPSAERPRQDSNLRTRLRRPMLYPLSYEGGEVEGSRAKLGWCLPPLTSSSSEAVPQGACSRRG